MIKNLIKLMTGQAPNCEKVDSFLLDYLEDRLDVKTKTQFEEHISFCKRCSAYFDSYKETLGLLEDARNISAPPELADLTLEFLRSRDI